MPYWGTIYRSQFTNAEGVLIEVRIHDGQTVSADPIDETIIELSPSGEALNLIVNNNDETPFATIRAKQFEIRIKSTSTISINTFAGGDDNRWYVTVAAGGNLKFCGYLIMNEPQQDFRDDFIGNEIILVATDNLGLLKDLPLTDENGRNPRGHYSIIQYIAWALQQTKLQLNINVFNNIMREEAPGVPFYTNTYLESRTFEEEIGKSISGYNVLDQLFKYSCFITQRAGEWYIMRIDEMEGEDFTRHTYDYEGAFIDTTELVALDQAIGFGESIWFSGNRTNYRIVNNLKETRLEYRFRTPREIIDNIDFGRGDLITTVSATEKHFAIDDWTARKGVFPKPITNAISSTMDAYTVRKYENDQETQRYIELTPPVGDYHWLECNPVEIGDKDKATFSVEFFLNTNVGGTGTLGMMVYVWLLAADGTYWQWGSNTLHAEKWHQMATNNYEYETGIRYSWARESVDETGPQTIAGTIGPAPASGLLYIGLRAFANGGVGTVKTRFNPVQFTYMPFINGSYQLYDGQAHTITKSGDNKAKLDEGVEISDSPRPLFKGGLKRRVGFSVGPITFWRYVVDGRYYNGAAVSTPDESHYHSYGHLQAFDVWNQKGRAFRLFDFQAQGLNSAGDMPDLIHQYTLTDSHTATNNKRFHLLHFDQNWKTCEWKGVMVEVIDTEQGKDYGSPHTFKYIAKE